MNFSAADGLRLAKYASRALRHLIETHAADELRLPLVLDGCEILHIEIHAADELRLSSTKRQAARIPLKSTQLTSCDSKNQQKSDESLSISSQFRFLLALLAFQPIFPKLK